MADIDWNGLQQVPPRSFVCSWCGNRISSISGWLGIHPKTRETRFVYVCPHCSRPTYVGSNGSQYPQSAPGHSVEHVPKSVNSLYEEARSAAGAGCHTAAVLLCRKLLMHLGVQEGAGPGLTFLAYVEYLAAKGFVPPNGKPWVDHIRTKGNEATHEINMMTRADSTELITFAEMLLRFMYEFPNRVPVPLPKP